MAGQWQDPRQWETHVQPHVQNSPPQGNCQQQWPSQYPPPPQSPYPPPRYRPPRPRPDERRTVTYQSGSNAFHWTMVVLTGGLWFLVWPFFRRKVRVTTRYR